MHLIEAQKIPSGKEKFAVCDVEKSLLLGSCLCECVIVCVQFVNDDCIIRDLALQSFWNQVGASPSRIGRQTKSINKRCERMEHFIDSRRIQMSDTSNYRAPVYGK